MWPFEEEHLAPGVIVSHRVVWPNGDVHTFKGMLPHPDDLTEDEDLSDDYLRLIDMAGRASGLLKRNEHLMVVKRDENTN